MPRRARACAGGVFIASEPTICTPMMSVAKLRIVERGDMQPAIGACDEDIARAVVRPGAGHHLGAARDARPDVADVRLQRVAGHSRAVAPTTYSPRSSRDPVQSSLRSCSRNPGRPGPRTGDCWDRRRREARRRPRRRRRSSWTPPIRRRGNAGATSWLDARAGRGGLRRRRGSGRGQRLHVCRQFPDLLRLQDELP